MKIGEIFDKLNRVEKFGADSLDTVELAMVLEESGVSLDDEIPDGRAKKIKSLRDLSEYIDDLQQK